MAGGVVEFFAEFDALPDLLALAWDADEDDVLLQWAKFLDVENANIDHIDEWAGSRVDLMLLLAEDAWSLCERAGLLAGGAPSPLGESVATGDAAVADALGAWLPRGWLTADGRPIAALLRNAAGRAAANPKSKVCPGLLTVEAESLIAHSLNGSAEAERLAEQLPEHRAAAMEEVQMNLDAPHAIVVFADFVCERHLRVVNPNSPVRLPELRASLMLAAHCGWLSHANPWSPVDHFAPGPRR